MCSVNPSPAAADSGPAHVHDLVVLQALSCTSTTEELSSELVSLLGINKSNRLCLALRASGARASHTLMHSVRAKLAVRNSQ